MDILKEIGKAAKKRLIDLEITQDELAEKIGVTRQTINGILSGKGESISITSLQVLTFLNLKLVVEVQE